MWGGHGIVQIVKENPRFWTLERFTHANLYWLTKNDGQSADDMVIVTGMDLEELFDRLTKEAA